MSNYDTEMDPNTNEVNRLDHPRSEGSRPCCSEIGVISVPLCKNDAHKVSIVQVERLTTKGDGVKGQSDIIRPNLSKTV